MATMTSDQRNNLVDSDFAYVDSDGGRHLPIHDEAHVRAAMARFNQTHFESDAAKSAAHAKIVAAAAKFGIDVKNFSDPGVGDVHVDAPLTTPSVAYTKSPLLKRLMRGLRAKVKANTYLTADDIETEYRAARGHAGGKARASKAAEPADWTICAACRAVGAANMPAPDCTCPSCQEGDPDDCLCVEVMEDDDDEVDPNAAHEMGSPHAIGDHGEGFRFFLPTAFAEAPAWINYLPKPGVYTHPTYGQLSITPERNQSFVQNFNAGVYQKHLPLDAEHESKLSGAVGYVTAMKQAPDGSVDAQVDWTDRGKALIAADRFRYFSPEWYDQWTAPDTGHRHENVAIGGAITSRPFFKASSLRPLVANEAGFSTPDDPTPFTAPVGNTKEPRHMTNETESTTLTEDEIKRFREIESENAALKQAAEAAQAQAIVAAERVERLEVENRRRVFAEQAAPWNGDTAKHVSFMEALPSDELRQQYAEQQTAGAIALEEALKIARAFKQVGFAGVDAGSAAGRLQAAADQIRANEPSLSKAQAMARATKDNQELYAEYEAENHA